MKKLICALLAAVFAFCAANAERSKPVIVDETPRSCTIRCAGDFVIHDNILDAAKATGALDPSFEEYEFSLMLSDVQAFLAQADFTVTNIDGTIGDAAFVAKHGYGGYPNFSSPASLLTALKGCGVDLLTNANNHAVDYWFEGLKTNITSIDDAGFLHTGAYRSQKERDIPLVVDINGIKVGFLNYTDTLNMQETSSRLDKDALIYGINFTKNANYSKDVKALRSAGAEVVVCLMHWGTEYRATPNDSQRETALALSKAGVDVIIGGHPHVVQRVEYVNGTLCLYSMGNFLSDQRAAGKDCGIIFDVTLTEKEGGGFEISYSYTPTWVWRRQTKTGGYEYSVLISSDYLTSRPTGMSDADYARMLESIDDIASIMGG